MYVVFTPLILALVFGRRIRVLTWVAVTFATAGLGLLSLQAFSFGAGEALTLAGALGYGIHIVLLGKWASQGHALALGLIQVVFVGFFLGAASLPGGVVFPSSGSSWAVVIYMALAAGLGAIVLQTWAQSRLSPTTTAVVMTAEPVFAAAFAVAFGGELVTLRLVADGSLILLSMVLIESCGQDVTEP